MAAYVMWNKDVVDNHPDLLTNILEMYRLLLRNHDAHTRLENGLRHLMQCSSRACALSASI